MMKRFERLVQEWGQNHSDQSILAMMAISELSELCEKLDGLYEVMERQADALEKIEKRGRPSKTYGLFDD